METSTPNPLSDFTIHIDFPKWWFLGALLFTVVAVGLLWYWYAQNHSGWRDPAPIWVPIAGGASAALATFCAIKFVTHLASAFGSASIGLGLVIVLGLVVYMLSQGSDRR